MRPDYHGPSIARPLHLIALSREEAAMRTMSPALMSPSLTPSLQMLYAKTQARLAALLLPPD
jgi:hypothetical protein